MSKNLLLSLIFCVAARTTIGGSTLYYNGKIHPNFEKKSETQDWLVVNEGRITQLGKGKTPDADSKIDLRGQTLLPALADAHAHLVELGRSYFEVDLKGAKSEQEAVQRISEFIRKNGIEKTTPITGGGWDQSDWPGKIFPVRQSLDTISKTQPIILSRIDGHAAWANTYALQHSAVWKNLEDPKGGKVYRNEKGEPEGVLVDTAMSALDPLLKTASDNDTEKYISAAVEQALSLGITSIHDAGASRAQIESIRRLLKKKSLRFRFYEMLSGSDEEALKYYFAKGKEENAENGMLTVRAVKLYADGAMGSRGAAFDLAYSDDPKNFGLLMLSEEEMIQKMKSIDQAGFQIAIHAIGSKANRIALNAMERALGPAINAARPRLEHAQVLEKSDIERISRLGVIASMQPTHCTSDMKWVVDRIGKPRARYSYAWNSLLKTKAALAFGSDAPVEDLNPWQGLFAAITRQSKDLSPAKGFFPEERLTLQQAFEAFTSGAAYAGFQETELGTLAVGKWADFILVSKNPLQLTARELRELKVEETYVGGEREFSARRN